jgi:ribosome-associated protein
MEMKKHTSLCDTFVVMSAPSSVRVKAIVDHIEDLLEREGYPVLHREGYQGGLWTLLDFGGVVAHVFHHETRKFYDLEHLWGDTPKKIYFH